MPNSKKIKKAQLRSLHLKVYKKMHLENNKLIVTMLKLEKPPNETEEVFKN